MVTKLYLTRHGETEGAEVKRYKGHIDVPLSDSGVRQIEKVAGYLFENTELTSVYCSDLSRAIKSAEIIAEPHGLKPIIMPELRERNFGEWEGMSFDEIQMKWPDAFNSWAANPLQYSPMGGESTVELRERAVRVMEKILNQGREQRAESKDENEAIAIVAHGGINRVFICELLGIPLENIFRVEQDYGCLNIIEIWDKYPVVKLINGRIS